MAVAIKHLAERLAEKRKENYSEIVSVVRCKLSFAIMRAALVCLRGSRSPRRRWENSDDAAVLVASEIGIRK